MSAAQEDILATPELLELILAQLPMRDLLVTAPLVSKTWRATTLVPALQRALFFLPSASSNSEPIQNLLLAAAFPTFFASHAGACYARTFMVMPWNKAPDAFKRPEASWRRMLLTQPPVRGMAITQTYSPRVRRAMLRDPEGLRMGVLYDLGVQFVHRSAASFRILWHHAGDIHFESNLTVAVKEFVPHGCMRAGVRLPVEDKFHSEAEEKVDVEFGKWEGLSVQ